MDGNDDATTKAETSPTSAQIMNDQYNDIAIACS